MLDYLKIIDKYYRVGTRAYKISVIHGVLVANKALKIADKLGLSPEEKKFIEEAAMLHDIGVIKVESLKMDCVGDLPYIAHGVAGKEILLEEGLPKHAQVAANHVGVGFTKEEIVEGSLPLPHEDLTPQNLAEEIITYADMFFSKREETLWKEDTYEEVIADLKGYNYSIDQIKKFEDWHARFSV
ncbi:MAG: HDIG domain-containing protein [Pseudomonadales bacterium]|jgi:uncharacterized protein|nr:HDIG domain-containing protein [Pseudomonadales bacterium]